MQFLAKGNNVARTIGLFLVVVCLSCNDSVETSTGTETAASTTDATPASTDAMPSTPISINKPKPGPPDTGTGGPVDSMITLPRDNRPATRKSATLGYTYPVKMYRGESKNINVYVLIRNQESRIRDTLKAIVNEQSLSDGDSVSINITNVIWYKTLSITLIDPAGDFTITPIHNSDLQTIDTVDGNWWRWSVKTTTDKKITEMILKVIAKKEDGTADRLDAKTIHIEIRIDRNIVRRFVNYLTDNPGVSIPILVSIFGFLGWYIKQRSGKGKA